MEVKRPSKPIYYLKLARGVSERSTCLKNKCGAVIVKNDIIVSTGYNGAPRGRVNCTDIGECYRIQHGIPSGTMYEKCLDGDTKILLAENLKTMTIREMSELPDDELPEILTVNMTGIVKAKAYTARATGYYDELLKITFNDCADYGALICTPDHRIATTEVPSPVSHLTYTEAQNLKINDVAVGAYMDWDYNQIIQTKYLVTGITTVENSDYEKKVYDLEVPDTECFFVETSPGVYVLVHNCRSVHGEQNAIIAADRDKMIGSTMYIFQYDALNNCIRKNPGVCQLCQRMIINAGIDEVILADPDGMNFDANEGFGIRVVKVQNWVDFDDEQPIG